MGRYYTCIYMRTPRHKWIKQLIQDPRDRLIVEICMHTCICVCLNGFGPPEPSQHTEAKLLRWAPLTTESQARLMKDTNPEKGKRFFCGLHR